MFRIVDSIALANLWATVKGNKSMNYEKLSRAMRSASIIMLGTSFLNILFQILLQDKRFRNSRGKEARVQIWAYSDWLETQQ